MAQTDYILRMIEQLGQMLAALRGMILGGETASQFIEQRLEAAATRSGLDLGLARAASPETIEMMVAPTGELEPGRCWMVAEILYLDGLHAQLDDRPADAVASFTKALPLYWLLKPKGLFLGLPEADQRIGEIEARLAEMEALEG